jgi:hypothetical protein
MTIYYQHIGEKLWTRDAPQSIGTPTGVRRFTIQDIESFLGHLEPFELLSIYRVVEDLAPTGFQIWGIPEGARDVLAPMVSGDFLLLLESTDFRYVGQVLHRTSQPCWDLSRHIWGESRFPLIILLQGEMITYEWKQFATDFEFASNYHMRGQTMRLANERVAASEFETEENFVSHLLTTTGTHPADLNRDFNAFANNLEIHFRLVKAREQQQAFRREVLARQGCQCAVCDIGVPVVLEAAHVVAKKDQGADDPRNGLVLCASHHRMFDAGLFAIDPSAFDLVVANGMNAEELRITRSDISHLPDKPHRNALKARWEVWPQRPTKI